MKKLEQARWLALISTGRVGGKTITALLKAFGSLEAVLEASPERLIQVPGVGPKTAEAIAGLDVSQAQAALASYAAQGIRLITWDAPDYPPELLKTEDAPPVLFLSGEAAALKGRGVAIVGTRSPTPERAALAERMAAELASRGWVIVSGLALGIDAAAHRGALRAQGRTTAVLGCGFGRLYPPQNVSLAQQITAAGGALLAEVPPQVPVSAQQLMARNRITSGLSLAVIVVQAAQDSGSLATARRARAQGRQVWAVEGGDAGCDHLIAQGAAAIPQSGINWEALCEGLEQRPT